MNRKYFHFTLGPVQSFVAQARRTRDFWSGSFILSWLSAVAMKAVVAQGGKIIFPAANMNFLNWLEGKRIGQEPEQGSVPNRFMACVDMEQMRPEQITGSVAAAWEALASAVFNNDLVGHASKELTTVWQRQVGSFWDISWIVADSASESAALDQRKNWRSHLAPGEPGVKCMMMDGLQEISGVPSPSTPYGEQLRKFWNNLRQSGKHGMKSDLRPGEHLCAVGFIKRRFARFFNQVRIDMPGGWVLQGWSLEPGRPSVSYMAAVHWLENAILKANSDDAIWEKLWDFHNAAHTLIGEYGEWKNNIHCIRKANAPKPWTALDGNVFFKSLLENENIYEAHQAKNVKEKLEALRKSTHLGPVSPFYAVLMMDGDSLGVQMSDPDKQQSITVGLDRFTRGIPSTVYKNNGFLIYAGGDDVLAVLPLEDAMRCALQIRQLYLSCFESTSKKVHTTLSGAIEYAHIKMPLTKVLKDAHNLLDNVAKDERGRDSLAVRVWKPGGRTIEWAMPWEKAIEDVSGGSGGQQLVLERLANDLQNSDDRVGQFSSRFFYKIRDRFELLNPIDNTTDRIISHQQAEDLIAAEYISSDLCAKYEPRKKMAHAMAVVRPLLQQCIPVYRMQSEPGEIRYRREDTLFADGALLVRFLSQKGVIQ